jgi:HNH endonuclease
MCGKPAAHMDHVKPLVKGGSNWASNQRPACWPCNRYKGQRWPYLPIAPGAAPAAAVETGAELCPHCGQPMPAERICARPDCGKAFRFRRRDASYCSARCARIMARRAYRERQAAL